MQETCPFTADGNFKESRQVGVRGLLGFMAIPRILTTTRSRPQANQGRFTLSNWFIKLNPHPVPGSTRHFRRIPALLPWMTFFYIKCVAGDNTMPEL